MWGITFWATLVIQIWIRWIQVHIKICSKISIFRGAGERGCPTLAESSDCKGYDNLEHMVTYLVWYTGFINTYYISNGALEYQYIQEYNNRIILEHTLLSDSVKKSKSSHSFNRLKSSRCRLGRKGIQKNWNSMNPDCTALRHIIRFWKSSV
jgi:hypothetical protein